ncbi:MAG: hypothetical protein Q7S96_01630, partial [bacterium]|nr:hypothetical protein [bacterium]
MRTMMLVLVVLAVSCGTPERMSPEAGDKEAPEQTDDTSSATRSDEVCLPKDVFVDLVTDDPALACESKVVIVEVPEVVEVPTPAECPNVTVTCEPEIIEVPEVVEVPAECPEQPICAPEAVETRPPTFSMFDSPLDVDPSTRPSDQFRFLDVRLLGGDRNATVKALTFYVARYGVSEGYDYGNWDTVAACEVFDCSSFRIYWVHDGGFELVSDDLDASGTIATKLSTPAEWSHELPANAEDYLSVYARVHGDAPSGRYHITFNTYSVEQDGVPVTIAGLPAHGPEFTIGTETPEACVPEATEEPTCTVEAATLSDVCIREVTARQHQAYYEQRIGCTHEGPYAGYCGR